MAHKKKRNQKKRTRTFKTTLIFIIAITILIFLLVMDATDEKKNDLMDELCQSKGYDSFVKMEQTSVGTIVQCQKEINEIFKFKEDGECRCLI